MLYSRTKIWNQLSQGYFRKQKLKLRLKQLVKKHFRKLKQNQKFIINEKRNETNNSNWKNELNLKLNNNKQK